MSTSTLTREKPVLPTSARPAPREDRPQIVTRAEVALCTCPEPCERDHEND